LLQVTRQPRIAGEQQLFLRRHGKHAFIDQLLQRGQSRLVRVQQLGVHIWHLGADAVHLTLVGVIPLLLGDLVAIHIRHGSGFVRKAAVAFNAEHHKRRNDQQEQQPHHELGVVADGIEHGGLSGENEKGEQHCSPSMEIGRSADRTAIAPTAPERPLSADQPDQEGSL